MNVLQTIASKFEGHATAMSAAAGVIDALLSVAPIPAALAAAGRDVVNGLTTLAEGSKSSAAAILSLPPAAPAGSSSVHGATSVPETGPVADAITGAADTVGGVLTDLGFSGDGTQVERDGGLIADIEREGETLWNDAEGLFRRPAPAPATAETAPKVASNPGKVDPLAPVVDPLAPVVDPLAPVTEPPGVNRNDA